jgi:hypothetical protein
MNLDNDILNRIQSQLPQSNLIADDLPNCDRWIVSSLLQKAIRRSDAEVAGQAAFRLHAIDRAATWRRMIGIAFEDVGPGSIDAVTETVAAAATPSWRAVCGEHRVLAYVVRRLADAPKDRSADYLMWAAIEHRSLGRAREVCGNASIAQRLELVADASLPLPKRAVAAWFSSGIDRPYERRVGRGDLPGLAGVYVRLGASEDLAAAAILAAKRTREPYAALVPLTWLEVQRAGVARVREARAPRSAIVAGLPLYGFDEHTRLGKRAINRLVNENGSIRACLAQYVPKRRWTAAAQHAAFYAESSFVSRRLDWPQSGPLEALGIESELSTAEVPPAGIEPLLAVMRGALDQLNEIRTELWIAEQRLGGA